MGSAGTLLTDAAIGEIVRESSLAVESDSRTALERFSDRRWRLSHLYWIQNEKGEKVRFRPNPVQEYILDHFWYFLLILKSRQHGVTTFFCILYLDVCLFNSDVHAGIVAHKEDAAKEIFSNKVKFAYENLPPQLRAARENLVDRSDKLEFNNGSSIYVDCSLRSGTFQYLHVSEFGPLCAERPDRAAEIVSGALNTVHVGQFVSIESTAKGQEGYFYDYCQDALKRALAKTTLNKLQFKFLFFGWYCDVRNQMDPADVVFTAEDHKYFAELEPQVMRMADAGVIMPPPSGVITDAQKAWYVAKQETQKDKMTQEHPSTPDEAFKASNEGSYYKPQFAFLYKQKRIRPVPYEPGIPVNTGWDLGIDDYLSIWFHQRVGLENRIIDYEEHYGEGLAYYVKLLQGKPYIYGTHYLPHDAGSKSLQTGKTTETILYDLGLRNLEVVERTKDLLASIEEVRQFLVTCWFDEVNAAKGVERLENYKKEWDKRLGRWKATPCHDDASHGADGFRTLACGYEYRPATQSHSRSVQRNWRRA